MKPSENQRKVARMAKLFGPGTPQQECKGCVSLVHAPKGQMLRRWVCIAAGGVTWGQSWPACGHLQEVSV